MADITVQDLQNIAVKCVGGFFNDNTPLSEGLAKEAEYRDLNSDQLKRAIEATNTLAYLKSVQVSPDRTGEFPLASYDDIIRMSAMPAGFTPREEMPADLYSGGDMSKMASQIEKSAEAAMAFEMPQLSEKEFLVHFTKEAAANKRALQNALGDSVLLRDALIKVAAEVKKDQYALEAVSVHAHNEAEFAKMAAVVWGEDRRERLDFAQDLLIPKGSHIKAAELHSLLKQASELVEEIKYRRDLDEKSDAVRAELEKQAFVGLVGQAIGKVVSAPFKAAGGFIKNRSAAGAAALADRAKVGAQNIARKAPGLNKLGIPEAQIKPSTVKAGKNFNKMVVVGGALGDAALYNPSKNKTTGISGDVFDTLYP